jgi:3'-phosphoadenosine 5'-phosphosulfate sulfotransferase (PAPS reductase)/FAD synthetase
LWLPINDWSDDEVHEYLRETGAPISPLYPHFKSIPDCARCPAWWTGLRGPYLKEHHPELFADYARDIRVIAKEIAAPINALRTELRETG